MPKNKILYIVNEISPFSKQEGDPKFIKKLAASAVKSGYEVRGMLPKLGTINERINSIHEVLRLSGVNINLGEEEYSLLVKVASIRDAKMQVYFMDNEELFERRGKMRNKEGLFYPDNDSRFIFFCKSALATIRRQEWIPDIIHCHGWFGGLIPLYLKKGYNNSALFKKTKCIYTINNDLFEESFLPETITKKSKLRDIKKEDLGGFAEVPNYYNLMKIASKYADKTYHSFKVTEEQKQLKELLEKSGSQFLSQEEELAATYLSIYQEMLGTGK